MNFFTIRGLNTSINGFAQNPWQVQITLDMTKYLDLINQYNSCKTDDFKNSGPVAHELNAYKKELLSQLYAPMFIMNFFKSLHDTIADKNSPLAQSLANPYAHINKPLVFDCVCLYFTEIIKNSIDAFVVKSLASPDASTILYINTQAWMINACLSEKCL